MAPSNLSPGGALLRTSRMFTMPDPIAPPPRDLRGRYGSDSSTQPYPTHQIVTVPESSRAQGDWGFKRPLPLRTTTKSSTPMIRIKQVDSIEHITDYSSATDLGLTLRKWQELNMPLTVPPANRQNPSAWEPNRSISVFEEDSDFTAIDPAKEKEAEEKRWKFRGPWLAGMSEGRFKAWLAKHVRPRRQEFRQYLKNVLATELAAEANTVAMDADGLSADHVPIKADPESITEVQLTEYLRALRMQFMTLYQLVGRFLDLAPIEPPSASHILEGSKKLKSLNSLFVPVTGNPYSRAGPPATHPSAGLSYLRTAAFLENHPLYGPQQAHAPVEARVITPRSSSINAVMGSVAKLGVAGFITNSPGGSNKSNDKRSNDDGLNLFKPDVEGGAKIWVQPASASVSSTGRVELIVDDASEELVMIAKELYGEEKVFGEQRLGPQVMSPSFDDYKKKPAGEPVMGSRSTYGISF